MQQPVKILVTGADGQLASEIREIAATHGGMIFDFAGRNQLSVTDETAVQQYFQTFRPDYCINCAAYTAVDKAENAGEAEMAERINATAVGYLARACAANGSRLIHISTDYVFDGSASTPYKPEDATNPLSVYGATKLKGEQLAHRYTDAVVIRTAWVYSSFGKNFVKTMMRLMHERPSINVVNDQFGAPTYARDLANAILAIIASSRWVPGTYHYTNEGVISWYDFAAAIKEAIHSPCIINPIPSAAYPTPAKRPAYSVLDTTSVKEVYNVCTPYWESSLTECIKILTQ